METETEKRQVEASRPDIANMEKTLVCNHVIVSFTPDDDKKKKKKSRKQTSICVMCGEKVKEKKNKYKDKDDKSKTIDDDVETETVEMKTSSVHVETGRSDTRRQMFSSSTRRSGSQVSLRPHVETCFMHNHKKIKYFCEDHQELCCSVCVNVLHPKCDRVMSIKDEVKTGFDESLCSSTIEALTNIRKSFEQIKQYNDNIMESVEKQCEEAIAERDELRDQILELLEEFERKTNKHIKKYMKIAVQEIKATTETCTDAIKDVNSSIELLDETASSKNSKDMFIATQKANSQKEIYAIALSDAINHTKDMKISLVPESNINNIENLREIGKVEFTMQDVSFPELVISSVSKIPSMDIRTPRTVRNVFMRSESSSSLSPRQPLLQGNFSAKLPDDEHASDIVAAAFLTDGRVMLADMKNKKLKVFDASFSKGDSAVLSSAPRDVVSIGPLEAAVALPDESKIQLLSIAKKVKTTRSILTDMPCYGVSCLRQDIVALCDDGFSDMAVQVMDLDGQVKETLKMSKRKKGFLIKPRDLALSPDGNEVCVTDGDRVVCFDMKGTELFIYSNEDLYDVRGLAIDNRGRCYVCGKGSNNVHQVSPDGQMIRILLTEKEVTSPQVVCVESEKGLLLVTSITNDTVSLYKMATT